jgi:SAM-dependent methyltransferase
MEVTIRDREGTLQMEKLLRDRFGVAPGSRVLDVGCGAGDLVLKLRTSGYDAYGADFSESLPDPCPGHLIPIMSATLYDTRRTYKVISSYRLPFGDGAFAAVVSTSVVEHVMDKEAFFQEAKRVLAPGGVIICTFPGSKYLPVETHVKVPLVNFFRPSVPRWWLAFWAIVGIRNEFQQGEPWRAVYRRNLIYCQNSLSYWPVRKYRKVLLSLGFQDFQCGTVDYLLHMEGGYAALLRRLKVPKLLRRAFCDVREVTISATSN